MYGNRAVGVQATTTPERSSAPDLTVLAFAPIELASGMYVERGVVRPGLFVRQNGVWHLAPNSDAWVRDCKPVNSRLAANLDAAHRKTTSEVTSDDIPDNTVDVVPVTP